MSRQEYKMHFIITVDRNKEIRMSSKIVDISICACDVSMFFKYLQTSTDNDGRRVPARYTQEDYYYYDSTKETSLGGERGTTSKLSWSSSIPRVDD